jgi:phage baseplate assembly protein W
MEFDKSTNSFLGRGWSFPPVFELESGMVRMVSEEEDIRESLYLLLSTAPGERIMDPKYGCDLQSQSFNEINSNTVETISDLVSTSILYFEPRITIERVKVILDRALDGVLDIQIDYTVRKTNIRTNIVYPFYIIEGTDLGEL